MPSFFDELRKMVKSPLLEKYFEPDSTVETMPLERLQAFQLEALKTVVTRAYRRSPFYRGKMEAAGVQPEDIKALEDVSKLPFTTKDELRQDPWITLACFKDDIALVHVATGTTGGKEIYVPWTWRDFYLHELTPGLPHLVDVKPGDICLNALPYEMSSSGLAFHKVFMSGCKATVIPAGKAGAYSTPEKTVRVMQDLQPTIVMTTPSYSMQLSEAAEAIGFDLRTLPLRRMWLTGEGCSFAFRERVEKIWGTKANFYYGSLEGGGLGVECDEHRGYHIPMSHVLVEIVDPETDRVLEPGEIGEIVVTCLLRWDTPLIRYRTQDLGYIDPDVCTCGIALPRLFLRGRRVEQIEIGGIEFSPFYLEEFLMKLPEVGNWYQFVVSSGADKLHVRTEVAPGVEKTPELAERLASQLEFSVGVPCEFELVDRIPRPQSKTIRVVRE